jgi:hypothetical protein
VAGLLLAMEAGSPELAHIRDGSFGLVLQVAHLEQGPHPRYELGEVERLRHEIIDAGIHRFFEALRDSGRKEDGNPPSSLIRS